MKSKEPEANRIGPVNPFALGNVFIEAAKKLGWMEEEQAERQRRYFITTQGFAEMEKLGMDLQRVAHYRPMTPRPEGAPPQQDRSMIQPQERPFRQEHRPRPHQDRWPPRPHPSQRHDRPRRSGRQDDRQFDRHRH